MATAHAKNRPPSAAKRWLPCPFSATVAPLYGNDESDASIKGDTWHKAMEDMIMFGTLPLDCDPDMADAMQELYDYVRARIRVRGPAQVYVEQVLDIPQTGEFGTADIILVWPEEIEIIDHKSGYVAVEVEDNPQLMVYLLGAIAKYGPRRRYTLSIHQPNYDHKDGALRTTFVTDQDLATLEYEIALSMSEPERVQAGPHCKATYCDHRGACEAFKVYCFDDLSLGWHSSELKAMSDDDLSKALDASDELAGWRTELRAEAMRRIMNMDRKIHGYKVVKGRRNRVVRDGRRLVHSVATALGAEWAHRLFPTLAWADLTGRLDHEEVLKHLGTPKHIEDLLKQYARIHNLPRGGWKQLYDNVVGEYIAETAGGLTLERAIDGRPAHKRGSEFGVIQNPANSQQTIIL